MTTRIAAHMHGSARILIPFRFLAVSVGTQLPLSVRETLDRSQATSLESFCECQKDHPQSLCLLDTCLPTSGHVTAGCIRTS